MLGSNNRNVARGTHTAPATSAAPRRGIFSWLTGPKTRRAAPGERVYVEPAHNTHHTTTGHHNTTHNAHHTHGTHGTHSTLGGSHTVAPVRQQRHVSMGTKLSGLFGGNRGTRRTSRRVY